jgi:hypothetical protein
VARIRRCSIGYRRRVITDRFVEVGRLTRGRPATPPHRSSSPSAPPPAAAAPGESPWPPILGSRPQDDWRAVASACSRDVPRCWIDRCIVRGPVSMLPADPAVYSSDRCDADGLLGSIQRSRPTHDQQRRMTMSQPPSLRHHDCDRLLLVLGEPRSHSCSFDHRCRPEMLRTAIATAFFWPTSTTSFLPRVTPV